MLSHGQVGKYKATFSVTVASNPCFDSVVPNPAEAERLAREFSNKIQAVVEMIADVQWRVRPVEVKVHACYEIESEEDQSARMKDTLAGLKRAGSQAKKKYQHYLENHDDNGKIGLWVVKGVDTTLLVPDCASAQEALERTLGEVESHPSCYYLGDASKSKFLAI